MLTWKYIITIDIKGKYNFKRFTNKGANSYKFTNIYFEYREYRFNVKLIMSVRRRN